MATEDKKSDLFADLSDHYVLILAGVVSLATFVPLFINGVTDILGWENIRWAYYLFLVIYFVLPYALYYLNSLSRNLKDYEKLFPQNENSQLAGLLIMPVALIYLAFPVPYLDTIIFSYLLLGGIVYGYKTCRSIGYGARYKKEAMIVFFVLIASTLLVLKPGYKAAWGYNYKKQDTAFDAYKTKSILNKEFAGLMDSAMNETAHYRMQAAALHPGPPLLKPGKNHCQPCMIPTVVIQMQQFDNRKYFSSADLQKKCNKLRLAINKVLKYDSLQLISNDSTALIRIDQIDASFIALGNYAGYIQQKRMTGVNKQWAGLLKNLQFNSICWSFVLIILSVARWYNMTERLRTQNVGIRSKANLADRQQNLDQLKSFILLSLILILPWFRPVDASTVNLSRPFINFNLTDLLHAGNSPVTYDVAARTTPKTDTVTGKNIFITNPSHITDTVKIIDTVRILSNSPVRPPDTNLYKWYLPYLPTPFKRDPMLDIIHNQLLYINGQVQFNQKLIKRIIPDPADRK